MSVYVDEIRDYGKVKGKWSHMWADTEDELHALAAKIGLKREWMHHSSGISGDFKHYDLRPSKRQKAFKCGAVFKPLALYIRERTRGAVTDDGDDGLLTCSVCRDRYTTNAGGVCDQCKQQAWLDKNA